MAQEIFDRISLSLSFGALDNISSELHRQKIDTKSVSHVKKRNGSLEPFDVRKIAERMDYIFEKMDIIRNKSNGKTSTAKDDNVATILDKTPILKKVYELFANGMSTSSIDAILIETAISKISEQPEWDIFAGILKLDNEEKKLRMFTYTERMSMLYHGTWPYIFEDYNVSTEMRIMDKEDNRKNVDLKMEQDEAFGSEKRRAALDFLLPYKELLEKQYQAGCAQEYGYDFKVHGPVLHEISPITFAKPDVKKSEPLLPYMQWSLVPSTKASYLYNGTTPNGMTLSGYEKSVQKFTDWRNNRNDESLTDLLIDRSSVIKTIGLSEYEKRLKAYTYAIDDNGRVVQLHSILSPDFYRFMCLQRTEIQNLVNKLHETIYSNMNYNNSTYQAIKGKLGYCLATPITKKYLESPHESIVRMAIGSVLGNLYDNMPQYIITTGTKKYVNFDIIPIEYINCMMKSVAFLSAIAIKDLISLPTPTRKNIGTRNSQGTSCILLFNFEDSISGIYRTLEVKELHSKAGCGTSMGQGNLRCNGSLIKKTNGFCSGTIPQTRLVAASTKYVNQAGARDGANACYYPWYHPDFRTVLLHKSTKQKALDDTSSAKEIFYAVTVDNVFMKRVAAGGSVSLFCPSDARILMYISDMDEFEKVYTMLEALGRAVETLDARSYFEHIATVALNGDPYCVAIDTANKLSMLVPRTKSGKLLNINSLPNGADQSLSGYGQPQLIRQSNLCCEVVQPTGPSLASGYIKPMVSACNLCSVAIPRCCSTSPLHTRIEGFLTIIEYIKVQLDLLELDLTGKLEKIAYTPKLIVQNIIETIDTFMLKPLKQIYSISDIKKNHVETLLLLDFTPWLNMTYDCVNALAGRSKLRTNEKGYTCDLQKCLDQKLKAITIFLFTFQRIIRDYLLKQAESITTKPDNLDVTDHSKLFMAGFFSTIFADSFIGYTFNLPQEVHDYQYKYRSLIVGIAGMADARINCSVSYWDLEKSLALERDTMESIQFGGIIASLYLRIFHSKTAYPKFNEGCMEKGIYHHELFGIEFGEVSGITKHPEIQVPKEEILSKILNMGSNQTEYKFKNLMLNDYAELYTSMFEKDQYNEIKYPDGYKAPIQNMKIESGRWAWYASKGAIVAYGLKNSTIVGNMPTTTSSVVVGVSQSFKPISGIHTVNASKSGVTTETCWPAVNYLAKHGYWSSAIRQQIATDTGSIFNCQSIPLRHKRVLSTAFEIEPTILVLHDAVRTPFTCQANSSNRYLNAKYVTSKYVVDLWQYAYQRGIITLSYYIHPDTIVKTTNNSGIGGGLGKVAGITFDTKLNPITNPKSLANSTVSSTVPTSIVKKKPSSAGRSTGPKDPNRFKSLVEQQTLKLSTEMTNETLYLSSGSSDDEDEDDDD